MTHKTTSVIGSVVAIIGATGSLALLVIAGRGTPTLLLVLFIGWVALPFAALAVADFYADRWSRFVGLGLLATSILIAAASLFIYSYFTFRPPSTTPARTWLLVPAASWLVIISVPIIRYFSKPANKDN